MADGSSTAPQHGLNSDDGGALSAYTAPSLVMDFIEVAIQCLLAVRHVYPEDFFEKRLKYDIPVFVARSPLLRSYLHDACIGMARLLTHPGRYRIILALIPASVSHTLTSTHSTSSTPSTTGQSNPLDASALDSPERHVFDIALPIPPDVVKALDEELNRMSSSVHNSNPDPSTTPLPDHLIRLLSSTTFPLLPASVVSAARSALSASLLRIMHLSARLPPPPNGCTFNLVVCSDTYNPAHDIPSTIPLHNQRGLISNGNTASSATGGSLSATVHANAASEGYIPWSPVTIMTNPNSISTLNTTDRTQTHGPTAREGGGVGDGDGDGETDDSREIREHKTNSESATHTVSSAQSSSSSLPSSSPSLSPAIPSRLDIHPIADIRLPALSLSLFTETTSPP